MFPATNVAAAIVSTIVESVTGFATGIGGAIVDIFDKIAMTADGGLTNFAAWALAFAGLGIITAIISAVLRKVG